YSDANKNDKIDVGEIIEETNYYPFGLAHQGYNEKNNTIAQNYKYQYNAKELQEELGLNLYDYGARNYDVAIGRWMNVDPLAEKFPGWNPYHYVHNNPVNLVDPTGMSAEMLDGPGDEFKSRDLAAKDFGEYYNGTSIIKNKEISSTIYSFKKNGKTYYSYTEGYVGSNDKTVSGGHGNPSGTKKEASIHSHGAYDREYDNNNFSSRDKWNAYNNEVDSYLSTPDGSLLKYNYKTTEVSIISNKLPSDPNDPNRQNNNQPKDNTAVKSLTPAEKREQHKNSYQYFGFN
ncbi:DUF4329 domain-containing protein, partial [Myroides sp. 1354]|uniref:DUF4329 domain-containing protein n=1 Tax=unclassified Myroides TaxID=2642485 RepID=UPI0025763C47